MERVCKNCRLYNEEESVCSVTILVSGESYELPVLPYDSCHWERVNQEIQDELKTEISNKPHFRARFESELDTIIEVKQMRMWSDGTDGHIEFTE